MPANLCLHGLQILLNMSAQIDPSPCHAQRPVSHALFMNHLLGYILDEFFSGLLNASLKYAISEPIFLGSASK